MAHDVFVSYAEEDKKVADAVVATLEAKGIRCWIAPRDVLPGQEWADSLTKAIKAGRVMILVFSSHANRSHQVRREVNLAIEKEKPIIPFRIEDVIPAESLEYYIDVTHWLDALTPPLEQHLQRLADVTSRLLGQTETTLRQKQGDSYQPKLSVNNRKLVWLLGALSLAAILTAYFLISMNRPNWVPSNANTIELKNSAANTNVETLPDKAMIPRAEISLHFLADESGWVTKYGHVGTGSDHPPQAGDFNNNEPVRGFLSFDLTDVPRNAEIESANVFLTEGQQSIDFNEFGSLKFEVMFYGSSLTPSAYNIPEYAVLQNSYGKPSSRLIVTDPIRAAIRQGYNRFQIRFGFAIDSNNNNKGEIYGFYNNHPRLEVAYKLFGR
jgi:hypothetical protein